MIVKTCPHPGCFEDKLPCEKHSGKNSPVDEDFYSSRSWRRHRATYLQQFPLCRHCQEQDRRITVAVEVDHIIPIRNGGDKWAYSNLQPLCKPHHSQKTRSEH